MVRCWKWKHWSTKWWDVESENTGVLNNEMWKVKTLGFSMMSCWKWKHWGSQWWDVESENTGVLNDEMLKVKTLGFSMMKRSTSHSSLWFGSQWRTLRSGTGVSQRVFPRTDAVTEFSAEILLHGWSLTDDCNAQQKQEAYKCILPHVVRGSRGSNPSLCHNLWGHPGKQYHKSLMTFLFFCMSINVPYQTTPL